MPIPVYQSMMLPLIRWFGDGQEKKLRDAVEAMSVEFRLTDADREQLMRSGQTVIYNRVAWACTYLRKAVLLETAGRGIYRITSRGREVLASNPPRIDAAYLRRFEEFVAFSSPRLGDEETSATAAVSAAAPEARTPDEECEVAYGRQRKALVEEVLARVMSKPPKFFEDLVVKLMVRMGYGGDFEDAGKAIGQSRDGGIDGVIKQDRLGLDVIYLQAKCWEASVGSPEIQKFAGALQGKRARKGVFLTTSTFTKDAIDYVRSIDSKIVLIDGTTLVRYMCEFNLGVVPRPEFDLKKLDEDFFEEE